jgi:hypothetical protein
VTDDRLLVKEVFLSLVVAERVDGEAFAGRTRDEPGSRLGRLLGFAFAAKAGFFPRPRR